MKQQAQARLSAPQIEAIRRKRQQGWTPREIEEDTGIDHVTVWRHTRNVKPVARAENEAPTGQQAPFFDHPTGLSSSGPPSPAGLAPTGPAVYQQLPALAQQQQALAYHQPMPPHSGVNNQIQRRPDARELLASLSVSDAEMLYSLWTNPRNLSWYNFFTRSYPGWKGNFADFVADAIEFMFKADGYLADKKQQPNRPLRIIQMRSSRPSRTCYEYQIS